MKTWIEQVAMKRRIDYNTCFNYLETFLNDQEDKEDLDRSIREIKKHFVSWLNLELKKPKKDGDSKTHIQKLGEII